MTSLAEILIIRGLMPITSLDMLGDGAEGEEALVRDLLDRAFGGSASKLVMQALSARRASQEELGEIRKLIEASRDGREIRDERD